MKLLGIDPGPYACGWALFRWDVKERILRLSDTGHDSISVLLSSILPEAEYVVLEAFVVYPSRMRKSAGEPIRTSENIGKIKLRAEQLGIPVKEFKAADHKRLTDAYLKRKGIRISNPHSRDAVRLVLWWLIWNYGHIRK